MIVMLFRLLILAAIVVLIYSIVKYFYDPRRTLEHAQKNKQFHFHDTPDNVRNNFLITYKGVLFEGEKYLGTTENSFAVTSISLWVNDPDQLAGFEKDDFYFIEREVLTRYPHATIRWKNPINQLIK